MWDSWRKPNYSVDALQVSTRLKALQHTSHLIQASRECTKTYFWSHCKLYSFRRHSQMDLQAMACGCLLARGWIGLLIIRNDSVKKVPIKLTGHIHLKKKKIIIIIFVLLPKAREETVIPILWNKAFQPRLGKLTVRGKTEVMDLLIFSLST